MNIPEGFNPELLSNIYQYYSILKKEVKNDHNDQFHPSPILKDKFAFNTKYYLLDMDDKYLTVTMDGCRSNEIILFHTDYDKDLKFKNKQGELKYVYAVHYSTRFVPLESPKPKR